ncbi:MAG: CDP-alcohol phosphatidyltransferase family protein [bacterium]
MLAYSSAEKGVFIPRQRAPQAPRNLKRTLDLLLAPFLALLIRLRMKPDLLTLMGALLSLPVCFTLMKGQWVAAALWLLAGSFFDVLDGALARALKSGRVFGAFLDSTMDRVSEAVVFLGFVLYYGGQMDTWGMSLAFVAGFLSQMISYTRARAEGLGLRNEGGWMTRPARILLLGAGLLMEQPTGTLWILAFLSLVTVFQRIYHVFEQSKPDRKARRKKA